jgi:mannose-6-phosphate isomerase-like protein (cupin superfamily)
MSNSPTPFVRPFAEGEPYTQPEPPGASFRFLLQRDEVPGLSMGLVTLEGPITKTPAAHDEWEQVYVIFSGSATVHLADKSYSISGPTVVVIPKNTRHSVECQAGQRLEYVYVNQYR